MGRDLAITKLARLGACLCLAAAISVAVCSSAAAAPADRAGDPVVLKGSSLPSLDGTAIDQVVAFRWTGKWEQVPVQVDERHVISIRSLYPEDVGSKYVIGQATFDIEVYADAKTRSGADADTGLDGNDEVVFMGGDTGALAPAGTPAPNGVEAGTANKIDVSDSVGGGDALIYLFRSEGKLDQGAGRDYVTYDFKLTGLTGSQTMLANYGYANSPNPEDSRVKTDNYSLHSTDRWMEDEIRISTGGATNADILDREAVSAGGLSGCGRSEYTFSGNWHLDQSPGNDRPSDDDEGTYVVIKDGPVRALRSFMGANSGPYVQSEHKYYGDHEEKTVYVRVHPIPLMYVWTDFAESAAGMTYRDQKNRAGVPVDGSPDTLVPSAEADFESGKFVWQQVTGPQGSATTMVTAVPSVVDHNNPPFTSYYLDDTTPTGPGEKQCGGDLKAYGASGFGIDGTFPNTDPILPLEMTRDLFVKRVRYFSGPGATAEQADRLRERTQNPLVFTAAAAPMKAAEARLKLTLPGKKGKARKGKPYRLKVKLGNPGNADLARVKVCASGKGLVRRVCKSVPGPAAGKSKTVNMKVKVKKKTGVRKLRIKVSATSQPGGPGTGAGVTMTVPFGR
ncbi:MAG TPA: hypothetical protein PKD76_08165 [Solirubrobacterales bacterium]|nr:hypothetical protein [Solirubrobacterales bacterium]